MAWAHHENMAKATSGRKPSTLQPAKASVSGGCANITTHDFLVVRGSIGGVAATQTPRICCGSQRFRVSAKRQKAQPSERITLRASTFKSWLTV